MLSFYGSSKNFSADSDIPDLSRKVILVTGGNNGLGLESARQFAKHGAHVFLAARTPEKGDAAIAGVKEAVPDANITLLELDLASLESVKKAADTFNASSTRLDVLMNNAGVMALPEGTTKDGYEIQFGTNHVGHALFTKLLLPTLQRTAEEPDSDVRIVNLTSNGHKFPPKGGLVLDDAVTDMKSYSTWTRYGQSKLANILFTKELSRRYPAIKSVAVHPGPIDTGLAASFKESYRLVQLMAPVVKYLVLKSPQEGALTQLYAATSMDAKSGSYYIPTAKEDPGSKESRDPELAAKLWNWTEQEFAKHGY